MLSDARTVNTQERRIRYTSVLHTWPTTRTSTW